MSLFAESSLHLYGTFCMFGAVLLLLFPICYIILPETKDISLGKNILRNLFRNWWFCVTEHIEQHFRRKSLTENCQLKGWQRLLVPEAKVPENDFHLDGEVLKHDCPKSLHHLSMTICIQKIPAIIWNSKIQYNF